MSRVTITAAAAPARPPTAPPTAKRPSDRALEVSSEGRGSVICLSLDRSESIAAILAEAQANQQLPSDDPRVEMCFDRRPTADGRPSHGSGTAAAAWRTSACQRQSR